MGENERGRAWGWVWELSEEISGGYSISKNAVLYNLKFILLLEN